MTKYLPTYRPVHVGRRLRSTTELQICGDVRQPLWNRLRYRHHHKKRHQLENRQPFEGELPWPPAAGRLTAHLDLLLGPDSELTSPSRTLCNLFWLDLDWPRLEGWLGDIRIVDLGCGNGDYASRLSTWAGRPVTYIGFDVNEHANWQSLTNAHTRFQIFDGSNFEPLFAESPTLIMSQSALEHVPEDIAFFEAAAHYASSSRNPVLQVHMIPGATLLDQYGLHGYRQYTRDNVRAIAAAAGPGSRISLFCLGDERFCRLHVEEFGSRRLRNGLASDASKRAAYTGRLRTLIETPQDAGADTTAFLCLVIEHGRPEHLAPMLTRSQQS